MPLREQAIPGASTLVSGHGSLAAGVALAATKLSVHVHTTAAINSLFPPSALRMRRHVPLFRLLVPVPPYRLSSFSGKSNRSHVDSVMAKVEERAKAAGGRVWAVMHARSRQRESNDSDHDDDRGGDGDHEGDREGNVLAAGLDESPSNGEALGYTRSFPGADGDRTGRGDAGRAGVNGVAGDTTYEWVLSTLDQMRQRGSPLDGEELGPGVDAGGARGVNPNGSAGTNEWGIEGMSSDSVAASFASLAERFDREIGGDGAGGDSCYGSNRRGSGVVPCISGRRATDEALAMLQAEMEEHASALSRLGVWMAKAVPARSGTDHMEVASLARTSSTLQHLFQGAGASGLVDAAPLVPSGGGEGGWGTGLPNLWLATMRGLPKSWPARASSGAVGNAQAAGDHGVLAALQLSRDLDVSEGRVRRERFKAHRAADDEIHRTPDSYKGSCILGNALILRGHDYLAQVKGRCSFRGPTLGSSLHFCFAYSI